MPQVLYAAAVCVYFMVAQQNLAFRWLIEVFRGISAHTRFYHRRGPVANWRHAQRKQLSPQQQTRQVHSAFVCAALWFIVVTVVGVDLVSAAARVWCLLGVWGRLIALKHLQIILMCNLCERTATKINICVVRWAVDGDLPPTSLKVRFIVT